MNTFRPDHVDAVVIALDIADPTLDAPALLALVLEGCLLRQPAQMRHWMRLRNWLVRPWKLRSPDMACPVSPLLAQDAPMRFAQRFPVQRIVSENARHAEVELAVDDRHLCFRTELAVIACAAGRWRIRMGTRVETRNRFGRAYMCVVDPLHRHWFAPMILRHAVAHAGDALIERRGFSPAGRPRYAMR